MSDLARFSQAATSIVAAGHFLYAQGWSPATSSNYSERLDDQSIAITVSGRHKGQLTPADVMRVDLDGMPLHSQCRPSAETLLHTALYRQFAQVGAVLHTHSMAATVLSRMLAGTHELVLHDYELLKAFPGVDTHQVSMTIPIFENTQQISELATVASQWLADHPTCPGYLIRGHGLYTWGQTMADCLRHIEAFEFLLNCELQSMRLRS